MDELLLESFAAIAAALVLLRGVTRELAARAGLRGMGRGLLAAVLGTGVIAFGFKAVAIVVLDRAPPTWLHAPLAPAPDRMTTLDAQTLMAPARATRWTSLPMAAPSPPDNPLTEQKVRLGRRLFEDKGLSLTREIACSSCHDLTAKAGADARTVALGIRGQAGRRNTPTVWNAAFQVRLFWDGRAASLEEQALGPITNPVEMGMPSLAVALERLAADPSYVTEFADAFGGTASPDAISADRLAMALAAFERTLITPDTPYDRFVRGDSGALSERQLRGMALFETVGCAHCHAGPNFSGASVFDGAAPYRAFPSLSQPDLRHFNLDADTGLAAPGSSPGVWRIPSLRNVAVTAPYFHNGSVRDLREAVRIMARTQLGISVGESPALAVLRGSAGDEGTPASLELRVQARLTEPDVEAIAAFLRALTSPRFVKAPARRSAHRTGLQARGGSVPSRPGSPAVSRRDHGARRGRSTSASSRMRQHRSSSRRGVPPGRHR